MEANHTGGNASIHTTCECSDRYIALIIADSGISIHAAREGGDKGGCGIIMINVISIHAAREGGDRQTVTLTASYIQFQSTPPVKAATENRLPFESVV